MLLLLILQIIFLCIFLIKKLKPIKYFMYIFKKPNFNIKNKKENQQAFPPKKVKFSDNIIYENDKQNNKFIKTKLKKNRIRKLRINDDDNNLNENKENNLRKDDDSERKHYLNIEDNNLEEHNQKNIEDIIQNELNQKNENNKNNLLNFQSFSKFELLSKKKSNLKHKKDGNIFSGDFSPIINIQNPIININQNNLILKDIKDEENSDRKIEDLNLDNKNNDNESINNTILKKKKRIKDKGKIKEKKQYKRKKEKDEININKMETMVEKENDTNNSKLSIKDDELQDMDYEEAVEQDKRGYLRMFWSFLVDSQIILSTFFTENSLHLFIIKLSFFVCSFQISFFLNALFYSDDYISDAYHNDGVLDFVSGLPKSIYSFVATLITTNLLIMLSNSKSELMKIIREKSKDNNYLALINAKLKKLRNKLPNNFIMEIFII